MVLYQLYLKQIMLQWGFSPKMLDKNWPGSWALGYLYHLIAMERSTIFKFGKPSTNGSFSMAMLVITRGYMYNIYIYRYYKWFLVDVSLKP